MKKKVEPEPTHCFGGFEEKFRNKETIMTQPKRTKDEKAELVKLIQSVIPWNFANVFERSIQRIVEEEVSMLLRADPYQRSEARTNYRKGYRERQRTSRERNGYSDERQYLSLNFVTLSAMSMMA